MLIVEEPLAFIVAVSFKAARQVLLFHLPNLQQFKPVNTVRF